jgi:SAM-dependent methyltransferase
MDIEPWFETRGTLFEVGAARGLFLKVMRDRGWSAQGIDISADAVNFARETHRVDVVAATPEEFEASERFNVVCMYQTLEHLPDPLYALQKARSWLQPGGVLVIEVPNADSFDIRISRHQAALTLDLPRHLSHFTPPFLCGQLKLLGFDILRLSLYPPAPLVTLLHWLELARVRLGRPIPASPSEQPGPTAGQPALALLPPATWRSQFVQFVSSVAPGWRFTVVARTKSLL